MGACILIKFNLFIRMLKLRVSKSSWYPILRFLVLFWTHHYISWKYHTKMIAIKISKIIGILHKLKYQNKNKLHTLFSFHPYSLLGNPPV